VQSYKYIKVLQFISSLSSIAGNQLFSG